MLLGMSVIFSGLLASASAQASASVPSPSPVGGPSSQLNANDAPLVGGSGGWRRGRATFYDAPDYFQKAFASRGEGAFGTVLYGDCQYYSRSLGEQNVTYANQAVPKEMIAALASADPDYPGSCGRCYQVRCVDGLVLIEGTTPVSTTNGYDLQAIAPDTPDTQGRLFPGNPARPQNENYVQCYNNTDPIFVEITDTCPCTSETANNTQWCCGPVQHFDLSFWAFEQLAHPLYGTMMLDFRPVDCATKQPFATFLPGYFNSTIYGDRVESGWSYSVYGSDANQFALNGAGIGGSNATCVAPRAQGGVTFTLRNGSETGYQPFAQASSIAFALVNNQTGSGVPSSLKFTIQNTEEKLYCGGDVIPGQTHQPSSSQGRYSLFQIPIADFGCTSPDLTQVDAIGIQNTGNESASFCLDDFIINLESSALSG